MNRINISSESRRQLTEKVTAYVDDFIKKNGELPLMNIGSQCAEHMTNIVMGDSKKGAPINAIVDSLPFFDEDCSISSLNSLRGRKIIDEETAYNAVTTNGLYLQYVDRKLHTPVMCRAAIRNNIEALQHVYRQNREICEFAIRQDPMAIQYVRTQTRDLCLLAVKMLPDTIQYIRKTNRTPEIGTIAVSKKGDLIKYVPYQTREMCLLAIQDDPNNLRYIRNQTKEICEKAISKDFNTLRFVKSQTSELAWFAMNVSCCGAFRHVKRQSIEMIERAISANPENIKYAQKQPEFLILRIMETNPELIMYVETPTREIIIKALENLMLKSLYIMNEKIVSISGSKISFTTSLKNLSSLKEDKT